MARFGNQFMTKRGKKISFDFRDEQDLIILRAYKEREEGMPWDASDEIEIPREIFYDLCTWLGQYASARNKSLEFIEIS